MNEPLKLFWQPELQSPSLIVGWNINGRALETRIADYLTRKLGGKSFGEIEPVEFSPLGGVTIEDDIVYFPESKFYACPKHNLVIFQSTPPRFEWHKFLNLVLDVAEHYCHVKELYTIGGMVSISAHTTPREVMATFNSVEMKETLSRYDLAGGLDYETPPGQRPTLNSFLLWTAKRRKIPAVSLWLPIPFYLVAVSDPQGQKAVLEFFNKRFGLGIDFGDLDEEIREQNQMIADIRNSFPEIDRLITTLESSVRLSAEESQELAKEIERFLKKERS